MLPASLDMPSIHDRAIEVARGLNGLRAADAIDVLENAKWYVLQASITATELIPSRCGERQTGR
jgi:hypothetical protein